MVKPTEDVEPDTIEDRNQIGDCAEVNLVWQFMRNRALRSVKTKAFVRAEHGQKSLTAYRDPR